MSAVERLLHREQAVVAAGLAVLTALAWLYLWRGAGMGMSALAMTRLALFPHLVADDMTMAQPPWWTVVAMWWVMMIAMMTPSAAPLVLLHARVQRHHAERDHGTRVIPSTLLALGYLLGWLLFSLVATALQQWLLARDVLSSMWLSSTSAALSAALLIAAGLYQWSPLKHACLRHCRGPVAFLTTHWRPGRLGALRLGLEHGIWCVGCCWLLMVLLFVGGIMNLAWIALLTLLVLVEKLSGRGPAVGRVVGAVLVAWGVATLLV